MPPHELKLLLVDDHAMIRETLEARLKQESGLRVVACAADADAAIALARQHEPDIVVMDIDMPGSICFRAAEQIMQQGPGTRIIFLSAYFHDQYIEQALAVQARAYVTKRESLDVVVDAIRKVAAGDTYFSEQVRERMVIDTDTVRLARDGHTRAAMLSARELEVLRYIARGMSKKVIAQTMFLSVKTVENYTAKLMNKLDIHDRVELTRYAIREGLVEV